MSKVPSIKGTVFAGIAEEVKKALASGQVSAKESARWLQPGDLELLEKSLSISAWYDIRIFDRFNLLLRDVVGGGDDDYIRELGRESARRLAKSGVYSQIDYLNNRMQLAGLDGKRARFEAFGRDLRLFQTIGGSIYNFGKWSLDVDPEHSLRYWIVWTEAEPFSDLTCLRVEGFSNELAAGHGQNDLWRYVRPSRDVVHYRMQDEV